jgi:hypothetical protein
VGKINGAAVEPQVQAASDGPVLACFLGRQRIGKSVTALALAETWPADRTLQVWDFDPAAAQEDGRTLSWFLPSARKPDAFGDQARLEWLKDRADDMIGAHLEGRPFDAICDFGGVEETLKRFSGQFRLVESLEEFGVKVVAIHVVGPDVADLRFLREVETTGVFKPKRAAIVLNEALVDPNQSVADAFKEVVSSPIVTEFRARGGVGGIMPTLVQMTKIEKLLEKHGPLPFQSLARPDRERLGFLDAKMVQQWRDVKLPKLREQLSEILP